MLGDEEALATDVNIGESTPPINETYTQDGEEEEDTKALFRVWLNERMAPTLLPFAESTMSNIMELISNQVPHCNPWDELIDGLIYRLL